MLPTLERVGPTFVLLKCWWISVRLRFFVSGRNLRTNKAAAKRRVEWIRSRRGRPERARRVG